MSRDKHEVDFTGKKRENSFATDFTKFDLQTYVSQFTDIDPKSYDGDAWYLCPFHDENTPSFHVTDKQVFYCHGCGASGGVLDFVKQYHEIDNKEAFEIIKDYSGQESVVIEREPTPPKEFYVPNEYQELYTYNNGFVLKYKLLNGKYIWANYDNNTWWTGTGNHEVELYAPNGLNGLVILAEGEKDADTLCTMGFKGASSPNGTYKWKDSYTEQLKIADKVVLLNDEDYPGIAGSQLAQRYLKDVGIITKRISPFEINDTGVEGYDISDVVEDIGLELTKEKLSELINSEDGWNELWNETQNETVEVEVMWESGMGEDYDNLIHKGVQDTLEQGFLSELTEIEISKYSKENNVGVRIIKNRIKERVESEKKQSPKVAQSSAVMKISDLGMDIDISGSGYIVDEVSSAIYDENGNEIIGHFLGFAGVVTDAESEQDTNVKVALAYNTPQNLNKVQILVVPKKMLATSLDMIKILSGYNINVTQANGLSVVQYLQDLQNFFNEKTITMKSLSRFGWFNDRLMPFEQEGSGIIFDSTVAQPTANKLLDKKGDRDKSLQLIKEIVAHSESGAVMVGAAVGSLILSYINEGGNQSFALNVWAETSTGKSVTAQGVASMFGYPFKDGFWGDGNATMNKDIYHNSLLGNLPTFIDDPARNRGYTSDQKRDYIFAVTSGQGRGRMQRSGDIAQDVREWCNVMIMTNETMFIDESIRDGGARARCLEVNFGDRLEVDLIEHWIDLMTNNYGHFAIEIADEIRKIGKHNLDNAVKKNIRNFNENDVDGKRGYNASIVMVGLELITNLLELKPIGSTREWLIKQIRGSGLLSDGARAYEKLMRRLEVSIGVYRNIYDRDGMFKGSLGYAPNGRKVINLPMQTVLEYSNTDDFDLMGLVGWAYANDKMYPKYDKNDKPLPLMISNNINRIQVVQIYFEWLNPQTTGEYNDVSPYILVDETEVVDV